MTHYSSSIVPVFTMSRIFGQKNIPFLRTYDRLTRCIVCVAGQYCIVHVCKARMYWRPLIGWRMMQGATDVGKRCTLKLFEQNVVNYDKEIRKSQKQFLFSSFHV